MTEKQHQYLMLSQTLSSFSSADEQLSIDHPNTWALARTIDDWLVLYINDDRVNIMQYERNVRKLLAIYGGKETI